MKRLFLSLLLAFPLQALANQGPSFDCAKASTDVEHAICDSEELSKMDREMATLYREFRSGLSEEDRAFAVQIQRQWLRQRAVCGERIDCLVSKYQEWLFNTERNVIAAKFELNDETRDLVSSFTGASMGRKETEYDFQLGSHYDRENICYEEVINVNELVISASEVVGYDPGCNSDGDLQYDSLRLISIINGEKWVAYRSYIYFYGYRGHVGSVFDVFVNLKTGHSSFARHSDRSESSYLGMNFELLQESYTDRINGCAGRGFAIFVECLSFMNSNVEQARYYFDNHLDPSDLNGIVSAKPLLKEFQIYIDRMKAVPEWEEKMYKAAELMPYRYICGSNICYENENYADRDPFIEQGFYTNPIYANLDSPAAYMSFEEWIYMFLARRISDGSLDNIEYMLRKSIEMMEETETTQQATE